MNRFRSCRAILQRLSRWTAKAEAAPWFSPADRGSRGRNPVDDATFDASRSRDAEMRPRQHRCPPQRNPRRGAARASCASHCCSPRRRPSRHSPRRSALLMTTATCAPCSCRAFPAVSITRWRPGYRNACAKQTVASPSSRRRGPSKISAASPAHPHPARRRSVWFRTAHPYRVAWASRCLEGCPSRRPFCCSPGEIAPCGSSPTCAALPSASDPRIQARRISCASCSTTQTCAA